MKKMKKKIFFDNNNLAEMIALRTRERTKRDKKE